MTEDEQNGLQALGQKTLYWRLMEKGLSASRGQGAEMEQQAADQKKHALRSMRVSADALLSKGVQP